MRSFEPGFLEKTTITPKLLQTVRLLGEFKGREELFQQRIPQALETLRQVAIIQSTESSTSWGFWLRHTEDLKSAWVR